MKKFLALQNKTRDENLILFLAKTKDFDVSVCYNLHKVGKKKDKMSLVCSWLCIASIFHKIQSLKWAKAQCIF